MPNTFRWDVFISHSSRDKARVRRLAEALRAAEIEVWFDEWVIQPGDEIYNAIEYGLEYARTLILCLPQQALASDWVKLERNTAIFRDPMNKEWRLVPVLLDDCKLPDALRRYAYVDWRDEGAAALEKIIQACRPPQRRAAKRKAAATVDVAPPGGALNANDAFYLERPVDAEALAGARRPAETIIIKAPRQMGKSSLLKRYLAECQRTGKQTVLLDFAMFDDEQLADYPTFLTMLAQMLWRRLGQPAQAAPPLLRSQLEMLDYLEDKLLAAFSEPVVFAFDEVDRVLGRPWQTNFFTMLRNWHERRSDTPPRGWARLGLALVISTEPYLLMSNESPRSPFNVRPPLELRPFTPDETRNLHQHYGRPLRKEQLERLHTLLNGHPYLTQLAFYQLTRAQAWDFAALWQTAAEAYGPFGLHLRALEKKLADAGLLEVMKRLAKDGSAPDKDAFHRLHGAGLARAERSAIVPENLLYRRFFGGL